MSGKKAKAKRKSAKKTAADSAPASGGARLGEFIVRDVRCFAGENRVPIRPITLLVGENSTGKTTFLGCYQRFVDMFSIPAVHAPIGAFTRPPFHMGGFSDIARQSGAGRKSREFHIGGVANRPGRSSSTLSLVYSFKEENGEAVPFKLTFGFPDNERLTIINHGPHPEAGIDAMFLKLVGPGFNHLAISPNLLDLGMNYNPMLGCINMGQSQIITENNQPDGDSRSARVFMEKKFGEKSGKNQLIPLSGAMIEFGECVAVAPIRPMPRRNYEAEVNGVPEERLLAEMARMSRPSYANPSKWDALRRHLEKFGKQSGMFSALRVENHGSGAGAPFSLRVNTRGVDTNIADVGYGVSQLLPFLVQVVKKSMEEKSKHFLFQQPEDHLHPRAQTEFASFMAKWANFPADWRRKRGHTFLVETHSDFIVNRVGVHVAKGDIAPDDVALLYFEPQKSGDRVKIHRIELNRNGEPVSVPKGYRDFFLHETERVLGLRKD